MMADAHQTNRCWLLLEKSDETRVSKGIDGYLDQTGELYNYDSLVPNHKNVSLGDFVVLRKESSILGVGQISEITESLAQKAHRRCPQCRSTDIRERRKRTPVWKCGSCTEEFQTPVDSSVQVRSFVARIQDFMRLAAPPSVHAVKACAARGEGLWSQHSMLELDPQKIRKLLDGHDLQLSTYDQCRDAKGQGLGLTQNDRIAVERHAMATVRQLFEDLGWTLVDTSRSHPYDFYAVKGNECKYIEVKGTTGEGTAVILTHGEVAHLRSRAGHAALVVVSGIKLNRSEDPTSASAGTVRVYDPVVVEESKLAATQYRFALE